MQASEVSRSPADAIRESTGILSTVGAFSMFTNILMLTGPLYMLQLYDRVLSSRSMSTLWALTAIAAAALLTLAVLEVIRSRLLVRVGLGFDEFLNQRVFSTIFAQRLRNGDTGVEPLRDLETIRQFLTGNAPLALFDTPWTPIYLALIFLFHPLLGAVATAGALLLAGIAILNELLTRKPMKESGEQAVNSLRTAEAGLKNADAVAAMGMIPAICRRWQTRHRAFLVSLSSASDRAGALAALSKGLRQFLQIAILGTGGALAIEGTITGGVMVVASIIMGRALAPVEQAVGNWRSFQNARGAYRRLTGLLDAHPEVPEKLQLPLPKGAIEVRGVTATAPGEHKAILKNVSFSLEPGEVLGIIGPNAAGKSTLSRLLVGIWRPAAGSVRLDGADLGDWDPVQLGQHMGYLPQDVELLDGTVAENIARFRDDMKSEDVVEAAQKAGAHEMILSLPQGYQTRIGAMGAMLSNGQRQRIALARALFGNPVFVVLDEPNSFLDRDGDSALLAAIEDLKQHGTTVVIVAHRPSTVARTDKVLLLQDGAVQVFGPTNEVLNRLTLTQPAPVSAQVA